MSPDPARPRPTVTFLPALLLPLLALSACDAQPEATGDAGASQRAAVDQALTDVYATFARAYRAADVQLLMDSVYADSGFYLPPGSPILRGQDQFRGQFSFLERFGRDGIPGPEIRFDIVDRDARDGLAYDIGTYTIRPPDAGPDAAPTRGKFIVVWKRDAAGQWRIHADGFSPVR